MDRVRLDLHLHTTASPDSSLEVSEILPAVRRAGLDGFAVTDHNSMAAIPEVERRMVEEAPAPGQRRERPLILIPGVEVSTKEGHLLAYFVPRPPPAGLSLARTVDDVHQMGGMAVLAHPFRRAHGAGRSLGQHPPIPFDLIETLNGHNDGAANARAADLAIRMGLSTTGGSDAHRALEIGRCFTELALGDGIARRSLLSGSPRAGGESLTFSGGVRVWLGNAWKRTGRGLKPL